MAVAKLRVHPNKFAALDGDGNPAGAFPEEGAPGIYIGATIALADPKAGPDPTVGEMLAGKGAPARAFTFEDGVIELPATNHYLYALRTGELLPADQKTASEANVKFVPVAEALAAAKSRAVAAYVANHGVLPACAAADLPGPAEIKVLASQMAKVSAKRGGSPDDVTTDGGS